jgi:hypothetical protein
MDMHLDDCEFAGEYPIENFHCRVTTKKGKQCKSRGPSKNACALEMCGIHWHKLCKKCHLNPDIGYCMQCDNTEMSSSSDNSTTDDSLSLEMTNDTFDTEESYETEDSEMTEQSTDESEMSEQSTVDTIPLKKTEDPNMQSMNETISLKRKAATQITKPFKKIKIDLTIPNDIIIIDLTGSN